MMNEKRFELEYDKNCYKCVFDNEKKELYSSRESICELLNALHQENISLDDENARLLCERIKDLEHFEECVEKAKQLKDENEKLRKENEQLKWQCKRLKEMIE